MMTKDAFPHCRVAEVGSLSVGAKVAIKIKTFVRRVLAIFATNASFLRVIANLQIKLSIICNMYHVIVHLLPKKTLFLTKKSTFLVQRLPKIA